MKIKLAFVLCSFVFVLSGHTQDNKPLRIFIRAGEKTHGPGQHDHPRFLKEGKDLLNQRGAQCDGSMTFPTAAQLEVTDVLVLYCQDGGSVSPEQRTHLDKFLKRGAGIVVIHDAVCGADPHWFKTIVGGAWEHGHSKWYEGNVGVYFLERDHPITKGVSNFEIDDEIYYDLHMMPEAKVLASSFHSVFTIAPQIWTYEKDNYRAFVDLLGHNYATFETPHTRALLLRGIAWAGKRDVGLLLNDADRNSLMYPEGGPTAPEKAAEKIVVHPEFTISLVAAEPMVQKAMSFDWDQRGRLWIAETPEYPNGRRINQNDRIIAPWSGKDPNTFIGDKDPRPARDRVVILEDIDHDGKMDQRTVWYEGLELVTSLVLYRDGVLVSQAPDIYWLRDKDGDGKAETKETLYTGFGNLDTHAVISNLRWGMDGWVYATVGYSRGDIKSGDGSKSFGRITEGVIRFRPDGSALEQVSSKGSNTWGMDFDWDNEIFFTQATSGDHLNHVVLPESVLARGKVGSTASYKPIHDHTKSFPLVKWTKQPYVQIDVVGGFTAAAGSCLYTGGAWPSKYNGTHFLSEPTISIVHQDLIRPAGTTFLAYKEREEEFITSRDPWFRPIHTRVGPDGALYFIDFYNQSVVHNDTRGPRHGAGNAAVRPDRDHYFGRIWRVQHKEAKNFEIPKLDETKPDELLKAFEHPNGWVRMRVHRLVAEMRGADSILAQNLNRLARDENASAHARIHALWGLENRNGIDRQTLIKAMNDPQPALRKNALRVLAETFPRIESASSSVEVKELTQTVISRLKDTDARTRLEAIVALGSFPAEKEIAQALVDIYPELNDPWSQSAVVGVGAKAPLLFLDAALSSNTPGGVESLVAALSAQLASKQDPDQAFQLVIALASKPASADGLKQAALENLVRGLKPEVAPAWSAELKEAFKKFIASHHAGLPGAALPLVARWDKGNSMSADVAMLLQQLSRQLQNSSQTDEERAAVASDLLGVHNLNREIIPSVAGLLAPGNSSALQRRVIEALGATPDAAVGQHLAAAYSDLSPELQEVAFGQIVKRADWTLALLQAVQERKINIASLGPSSVHRLRTHSDKAAAQRANAVIDEIRGPEMKEKNELIATFTPVVENPGNLVNGHKIFSANCANCHKFRGEGRDVAPDLTGMGAHGQADLLVHILDPNRFVEANYLAVSIETKDNEVVDGIVARENRNSVVLRNASGDVEIKTDNIQGRRSTGLSLMPSGFEALGGEGLRDLLSYICAGESKYRLLDLTPAFTANGPKGIYVTADNSNETLQFKKFGVIKVGDIPFQIVSPSKSPTGNNVCVLKGGSGFAKSLPKIVEIKAGVKATQLHFLGGVGGWAYPWGDKSGHDVPVMKVAVHYADNQTEEIVVKNGQEVADYNGSYDVPGSKAVPDLVRNGQVRWFSKPLKRQELIDRISLESFDNHVAPTVVAVTAEVADASQSAANQTATPSIASRKMTLTLIVGGGSSHDFDRWFNREDSMILQATDKTAVSYTENPESILPLLRSIDVLYLSNNQPLTNSGLREGIIRFADAGKGLLLVHPALWYNWKDWPEYNRVLVGGGSRSHDKYGEFEVTLTEPAHPILASVPKTFKITDELYRFEKDPEGSPIQVLATGKEPNSGKTYPILWIVQHPKGRIVCNTLGHDGQAHQHQAYKTILQNSLLWVTKQSSSDK